MCFLTYRYLPLVPFYPMYYAIHILYHLLVSIVFKSVCSLHNHSPYISQSVHKHCVSIIFIICIIFIISIMYYYPVFKVISYCSYIIYISRIRFTYTKGRATLYTLRIYAHP